MPQPGPNRGPAFCLRQMALCRLVLVCECVSRLGGVGVQSEVAHLKKGCLPVSAVFSVPRSLWGKAGPLCSGFLEAMTVVGCV